MTYSRCFNAKSFSIGGRVRRTDCNLAFLILCTNSQPIIATDNLEECG